MFGAIIIQMMILCTLSYSNNNNIYQRKFDFSKHSKDLTQAFCEQFDVIIIQTSLSVGLKYIFQENKQVNLRVVGLSKLKYEYQTTSKVAENDAGFQEDNIILSAPLLGISIEIDNEYSGNIILSGLEINISIYSTELVPLRCTDVKILCKALEFTQIDDLNKAKLNNALQMMDIQKLTFEYLSTLLKNRLNKYIQDNPKMVRKIFEYLEEDLVTKEDFYLLDYVPFMKVDRRQKTITLVLRDKQNNQKDDL